MKSSNALNELVGLKLHDLTSVRRFDTLLAEIAEHNEPESLPVLFGLFDDDTEHHEVMFGLVHLVEELGGTGYVPALLDASVEMAQKSPEWFGTLLARIINSARDLAELEGLASSLSGAQKHAICSILASPVWSNESIFKKSQVLRQELGCG